MRRERGYEVSGGSRVSCERGSGTGDGAPWWCRGLRRGSACGAAALVSLAALALLSAALTLATQPGCGGDRSASEWIEFCGRAVEEYAARGGYLRFTQESRTTLTTPQGSLDGWLRAEGDIILPDRERYEYREELSSTTQPGETSGNSFSYLTVDGGETAFVSGENLEKELGISGWVHYKPPQGQNRYFDYLRLVGRIRRMGEKAEKVAHEDIEGRRCVHVVCRLQGREVVDLYLQEDPSFMERIPGAETEDFSGEVLVRVWVDVESGLPLRVLVEASTSQGEGVSASNRMEMRFSGYHDEPPSPIEAPGSFTEAS